MSDERAPSSPRWSRSQRFTLSEAGTAAAASYMETVIASRSTAGRASFDAARAAWAGSMKIAPDDGLYLQEAATAPVTIAGLVEALDAAGQARPQVIAAINRLVAAGLVLPVEAP